MDQMTFSQKLKRLEEVVSKLESPDLELEDGLKLLEEGVGLHKDCQQMLTQTQAKITKLLDNQDSLSPIEIAEDVSENRKHKDEAETDAAVTTLFEAADVPEPKKQDETESGLPF